MIFMAQDNKGLNSFATGVAGAVICAAAAAAAIALSDEKNRKKAEKILEDMEKEGNKVFREITRLARQLQDKSRKVLAPAKIKTKRTVKSAKKKRS